MRQDFAGASRVVQAVLAAQPNHTLARNLEREIARGVEQRTRAAAVVERARALFDASPGEAMELLERFTPAHGLVDSALAEMRERHAERERERLRLEKQAQRQQQIAAADRAGRRARPQPRRPRRRGGAPRAGRPRSPRGARSSRRRRSRRRPSTRARPSQAPSRRADSRPEPTAVTGRRPSRRPAETPRRETPTVDAGATETTPKTPVAGVPAVPPDATHGQFWPASRAERRHQDRTPPGVQPRPLGPAGRGVAAAGEAAKPGPPDAGARTEPAPETPRDTAKVTAPPAGSDLVESRRKRRSNAGSPSTRSPTRG